MSITNNEKLIISWYPLNKCDSYIKNTILKKGTDFTVLPKEIKEEIKQKVPSILSRTQ